MLVDAIHKAKEVYNCICCAYTTDNDIDYIYINNLEKALAIENKEQRDQFTQLAKEFRCNQQSMLKIYNEMKVLIKHLESINTQVTYHA